MSLQCLTFQFLSESSFIKESVIWLLMSIRGTESEFCDVGGILLEVESSSSSLSKLLALADFATPTENKNF